MNYLGQSITETQQHAQSLGTNLLGRKYTSACTAWTRPSTGCTASRRARATPRKCSTPLVT